MLYYVGKTYTLRILINKKRKIRRTLRRVTWDISHFLPQFCRGEPSFQVHRVQVG